MLELLVKYTRDHGLIAEPGFKSKSVRWAAIFDENGNFLDVIERGDTSKKRNRGHLFPKCPDLSQPEMKAGGIIKSHFLADTVEVVALLSQNPHDKKLAAKHDYFIHLMRQSANVLPEFRLLAEQLSDPEVISKIVDHLKSQRANPNDKITFRIGNSFPLDSDCWHEWWRNFRKELVPIKQGRKIRERSQSQARLMRCFATGESVDPENTHPKITGLTDLGKVRSGDVLIGYKQDSFCSYGLNQSENAAVSKEAAAAYRSALNSLIDNGQTLVGPKLIHWFKKKGVPKEDDPFKWLEEPEQVQELNAQQRARGLLQCIQTGKRPDLGDNYFYALTLSGGGGRVMTRDWMDGQFEALVENVCAWFDDLEIVNFSGAKLAALPKLERVITCLLQPRKPNQDYQDWIKPIGSERISLWHSAAKKAIIPYSVLARLAILNIKFHVSGILEEVATERNHPQFAETISVLHARMGLMKAYHVRKYRTKGGISMGEDLKPYLNENHPHPAYHCGRLMAVLARLQNEALGDVGAGVVQRYYAAASCTPALVLGRLTRNSQPHLGSLKKAKPGLAIWYESKIANIWSRIKDDVPRILTLEEQTLFALGYYQQMADRKSTRAEGTDQNKEE